MFNHKTPIVDGILIAGITAAGYWLAFLYEMGYCKYFNIPSEFIEVGILNIMVAVVSVLGVLAMLNMYINPFHMLVKNFPRPLRLALYRVSIPLVLIACYGVIVRLPSAQWFLLFAIFGAPLLFFEFVFPLITQRKVSGYIAKLEAQDHLETEQETLIDTAARAIGRDKFLIVTLFMLLSMLAFFAGGFDAKLKRSFIVLRTAEELVVVKTRGDFFLAASFDRNTKSLKAEYRLIPISPSDGKMEYEKLGPLEPQDKTDPKNDKSVRAK